MSNITVEYYEGACPPQYNSFFKSLQNYNKTFDVENSDIIAIVSKATLTLGVVCLKVLEDHVEINIVQSPKVCRMSILALIESAVYLIKHLSYNKNVVFTNVFYAHVFKLKSLFNLKDDYGTDTSATINIQIKNESIVNLEYEDITQREIIVEKGIL